MAGHSMALRPPPHRALRRSHRAESTPAPVLSSVRGGARATMSVHMKCDLVPFVRAVC